MSIKETLNQAVGQGLRDADNSPFLGNRVVIEAGNLITILLYGAFQVGVNMASIPLKGRPIYVHHALEASYREEDLGRNKLSLLERMLHPTDWAVEILMQEYSIPGDVKEFYSNLGLKRSQIDIMKMRLVLEEVTENAIPILKKRREEFRTPSYLSAVLQGMKLLEKATWFREPQFWIPMSYEDGLIEEQPIPKRY